jgi:hypothetical protein
LHPGETAQWTVYFDPRHHGTYGDHNHSLILNSNDADQPSLEVPTVANVVEKDPGRTGGG